MTFAMDRTAFDADRYLSRIHHFGNVRLTREGLEALHRAQLYAIPFENFDILLGREVSLEPGALFSKLVRSSRGGYCFELNGLFLLALQAFGFNARPLLARVHRGGEPSGRGHQITLVRIGGQDWISDVGFGSPHLPAPLPLEIGYPTTLEGQVFRLADARPFGIMLQVLKAELWHNLYSFDLGHVCPADIAYGHHFTSTHPRSFFTFTRVAALPFPGGGVTLFNRKLTHITSGMEKVCELEEGQAYLDALRTHFGIELNVPYAALPPLADQHAED